MNNDVLMVFNHVITLSQIALALLIIAFVLVFTLGGKIRIEYPKKSGR